MYMLNNDANFFERDIFNVSAANFEELAIRVFRFQYEHNQLYRKYTDALHINPAEVRSIVQIPFLPISFFKTNEVHTTDFTAEVVFESSGTTQTLNSRHFVKSKTLYRESFNRGFELFYGPVHEWCILALLPAYLERSGSSLVFMTKELIEQSRHPASNFYLYDHDELVSTIQRLESEGQKTMLLGVTFALLDLAEKYRLSLNNTKVMETGGMKGRHREMVRPELHEYLQSRWGLSQIDAEYGMTEMLSQAYSAGNGIFRSVPWLKVLVRDENDPLDIRVSGTGVMNVIDLANIYSCAFIATDDGGRIHPNGDFEILGRTDHSDLRGCSLMVADAV